jgi:spore germination protein GerM
MRRAPLIALALVFVLPGCGGGSSKALTKEEYAAKADAICGKYNQQTKALASPKTLSDLATVADQTLPILDHALKDFSKLQPPVSEKALADQWVAQVTNLKEDLQRIRDKAKTGDLKAVQQVVPRAQDDNSRSNQLATKLGMSVCNKN